MLATSIIIALSVLSCNMAEAKKNYTFAVVPKSTSNPFFQSVESGCAEQANLLTQGSDSNDIFTCLFTGPVGQDATEQVAIVKNLIDAGEVDGIALSVIDEASGDEIINSATAAGLPIITFDSDAPNSERKAYVGTDNIALGKELAHVFRSRFTKSPTATGMYAILSDTNPNLILREQGIRENLSEGWEEVSGSPTDFGSNATLGVEQAQDLMKKYPGIAVLFSAAGRPMRAPDDAWAKFSVQYPDVIKISVDNLPEQIELLNRGLVNGLVGQQPFDMGAKSIDTLLKLSQGSDVMEFVPTDMEVIARVSSSTPFYSLEDDSSPSGARVTLTLPYAPVSLLLLVSLLLT